MRQIILQIAVFTLALGSVNAAEIYRHVDEHGNVEYSDQPAAGAKKVEVNPVNIDASPKPQPAASSNEAATEAASYTELTISAPKHNTTLRNISEVTVTASLSPGLDKQHRIRFLDNGTVIAPPSRTLSVLVSDLERGTHQLQAEVIDDNDQVIIASEPVAVHVHQPSTLNPSRTAAP